MVNDFVDVSQIEAGRLRIESRPCDVVGLIKEVVAVLVDTTPAHRIEVSAPNVPVVVHCDPLRIEQAVENLMSNAIKYSPPDAAILVRVAREDTGVMIEVRDEGPGISDVDQQRLFKAFHRVGSYERIPGIGLGLFVTHGIVEAHRGTIEVVSAAGRGSTFRIHLPADGAA